MSMVANTFLFRLYKEFKLLFVLVAVWAIGTLWFALKSREEFPFLLFGMYSLKEKAQAEYTSYSVVVEGKEMVYSDMKDAQHEMVATTLSNTVELKTNPIVSTSFVAWFSRYAAGGKRVEIYKLTCLYSREGEPLIRKRELIYPHE